VGMAGERDAANRNGMVWNEARQDTRLLELYRRLGRLRRLHPALRRGGYERLTAEGAVVVFARQSSDERLVVVANAGIEPAAVAAKQVEQWAGGGASVIETVAYGDAAAELGGGDLRLPPQGIALLRSGGRT